MRRLLDIKGRGSYFKAFTRDDTLDPGVSTLGGDPRPVPEVHEQMAIRSGIGACRMVLLQFTTAAYLGRGGRFALVFETWLHGAPRRRCARGVLFDLTT